MWIRLGACALVFVAGTAQFCPAQSDDKSQLEQLQRQIAALQQQLEKLHQPPAGDEHVTQIGSATQAAPRGPELVIRFYDLSDLFMVTPTYEAERLNDLGGTTGALFPQVKAAASGGAGMGGMGGGMFNAPAESRTLPSAGQHLFQMGRSNSDAAAAGNLAAARTSIEGLVDTITATIHPSSWDTMGGPGTITRLGGALVISTTADVHQQIDNLLKLFRKRWGGPRVISLRAWWLWLDDAQIASLLGGKRNDEELGVEAVVDETVWKQLLDSLRDNKEGPAGYRAAVTCYNGQTVHTESGGQSLAVTDIKPIGLKGEDGKQEIEVTYQPTITVVQDGSALQVTPIASSSGKFVVLDVHSRVTRVERQPKDAFKKPEDRFAHDRIVPAEIVAAIDRPLVVTHRLSTTMRVPVGHVTLVGGMTFDSQPVAADPALYLFVRAAVREVHTEPADAEKKAVNERRE